MDFFVSFTVEDRDWADWISSQLDSLGYRWSFGSSDLSTVPNVLADVVAASAEGRASVMVVSSALLTELGNDTFANVGAGAVPSAVGLIQVEALRIPEWLADFPIAAMHLAPDDFAASRELLAQLVGALRPAVIAAEPVAEAAHEPVSASITERFALQSLLPQPAYPVPVPPELPALEIIPAALVAATEVAADLELAETASVEVGAGRSAGLFATDWGARPWETAVGSALRDPVINDEAKAETLDQAFVDLDQLDPLLNENSRSNGGSQNGDDADGGNEAVFAARAREAIPVETLTADNESNANAPTVTVFAELSGRITNISQPRTRSFWNRTELLDHLARSSTVASETDADNGAATQSDLPSDDGIQRGGLGKLTLDLRDGRAALTITSLVGPRGVGKTALTREVVAELASVYDVVWWVRAADRTTYLADLAELADRVAPGEAEPDQRLREWLGGTPDRWLLIFDDVPTWDVVQAALPPAGNGTVFVTAASGVATDGNVAEVERFGLESATGFLLHRASRTDRIGAAELAEHLNGNAAALELAGAYVAAMSLSFEDYLAELGDTSSPNGMSLQAPGNPLEAAVLAALRAISFYSTRAASAAVGLAATATAGPLPLGVLDELSEEAENPLGDLLASFGLIVADDTHVAMPPSLRDAIRAMAPEGPAAAWAVAFADALERAHGDDVDPAGTTLLLAHAADLVTTGVRVGAVSPSLARLAVHAGAWATWAGDSERGIGLVRCGLELSENQLGADHPETESARRTLAELDGDGVEASRTAPVAPASATEPRGSIGQSEAMPVVEEIRRFEEDLLRIEAEHGPDSIDALAARNVLAGAYVEAGDRPTAERLLREVFERCVATLGVDHIDSLTARANLANSYADHGDYAQAVELQESVAAAHERVLGNEHPYTLTARNNLANTYATLGRHDEALRLQEHVVADYERTQGRDHPNSLTAKHNLANSYADLGRHEQALQLREQVLEQRERVLGADHPQTLGARNNLANSYADLGRHEQALQLREQVLEQRERVLGADHPQTLGARNNLANSYADLGRHEQALQLREQVLEQRERLLGADHPHTLTARNNLANSYAALGRHGEALILRERALTDCDRILGTFHPHTLTARNNLANTYGALGDDDRAQQLRGEVLASRGLSSRAAAAVAGMPMPSRESAAIEQLPDSLQPATDTSTPGRRKRRFWFFGR